MIILCEMTFNPHEVRLNIQKLGKIENLTNRAPNHVYTLGGTVFHVACIVQLQWHTRRRQVFILDRVEYLVEYCASQNVTPE